MGLSHPLNILKKSASVTVINGAGTALAFLVSVYAANHLGPSVFGEASFVVLWVGYAGLLRAGLFEGGQRELIHRLGRAERREALLAQNVGFSGEMLWCLAPAAFLAVASPHFPDPVRRIGFLIAPVMYAGTAVTRMLAALHLAQGDLGRYTSITAMRAVGHPVALAILLGPLGPLALVAAPALVECGVAAICLLRRRALGLAWRLDATAGRRLLRSGFPLGLAVAVYWSYRLAGTTSVAVWLPPATLGCYAFGSKLIDVALRVFGDFSGVLMPSLWSELAAAGTATVWSAGVVRTALFLAWLSCLVCNMIQATAGFALAALVPTFTEAAPMVEILSFNVVLLTVSMVPSLVLDSRAVNRQWKHLSIWVVGVALKYPANLLAIRLGGGAQAVAWNDIVVQLLMVVLIYRVAHDRLFGGSGQACRFHVCQALLVCLCAGVSVVLARPGLAPASGFTTAIRAAGVAGLWSAAGYVLLRRLPVRLEAAA